MSCGNCNQQYSGGICGCGSSFAPAYTPQPNCHHCPTPPPIPPCGCNGDGSPVWHALHPLIPMARYMLCGRVSCLDDDQLACNLRLAETLYSTCRLAGERYYHAIIYHALAMNELATRIDLYNSGLAMGIAIGKESKQEMPTIFNSGFAGLQLGQLLDSSPNYSYLISC